MTDSLRKEIIEIGWRINTKELDQSNSLTDKAVTSAGKMEGNYRKASKGVDVTTTSLEKSAKSIDKNTAGVDDFSSKAVRSFDKSETSAKELTNQIDKIGTEFDDSAKNATEFSNKSAKSINSVTDSVEKNTKSIKNNADSINDFSGKTTKGIKETGRVSDDARKKVKQIGDEFDDTSDSAKKFGQKGSKHVKDVGDSASESRSKVEALAETSERASERISTGFSKAKVIVAAIGGVAISSGKQMFELASDYNEAVNKVETAFDSDSSTVKKWSENTRKNIGLARGTALDLAAGYGDMATSMELGTDEAADMSMSMVNLAADLASFKNKDIDQINTALNGVFTGEGEALKGLGIVMTQANLEQFALSQGMLDTSESAAQAAKKAIALEKAEKAVATAVKKHGKNSLEARDARNKLALAEEKANEQAKANLSTLGQAEQVRLRYNYVMSKTKNAQGDFVRNSTEAANATRIFSETVKETGDKLGQNLLPIFTPLIIKAAEFVEKGEKIPEMLEGAKEYARPFYEETAKYFGKAKDFFVDEMIPSAKQLVESMGPGAFDGIVEGAKLVGWGVDTFIVPPFMWLKEFADDNPDMMRSLAKWAGFGVTAVAGFGLLAKPIFAITGKVNSFRRSIERIGDSALVSAGKAKLGFGAIEESVPIPQTTNNGSLLDETGELIQTRSERHVKPESKAKKGAKWLFNGADSTAKTQTKVPSGSLLNEAGELVASRSSRHTTSTVGKHVGKMTLGARAVGTVSKGTSIVKTAAKAVPGISYITAATNLIGMNKDNIGDKVGGSIGTMIGGAIGTKAVAIAGAKFGALAGTVFGPVGTAVGGVLGTGIGLAAGSKIGKEIQAHWPEIEGGLKNLWDGAKDNVFTAPIAISIESNIEDFKEGIDGAKQLIQEAKDFFADPFEDSGKVEKTKGVSKETTKEVNNYLENYNEVSYASSKIKITGEPMTDKEFDDLMKTHDEMRDQVVGALEEKASKSTNNLDRLFELGVISKEAVETGKRGAEELADVRIRQFKEANQKIKDLELEQKNETTKQTEIYEKQIASIKKRASDENRALSKSELEEIQRNEELKRNVGVAINKDYEDKKKRINESMKEDAVLALSDSAKEQKIILGNLNNSSSELSAKQAASIVENSYKAKEETIKNANDKYEETKRILDEERYVSGSITQEKYEEALRIAKDERDGVVQAATETHDEVISKAKSQASGHIEQVNWETGETLSKWDVFKNDFSAKATEIADGALATWKRVASGTSEWFGKAGDWAVGEWNSFMTDLSIVVNKIIDGINVPLKFFGAKEMQHWTPTAGARANASGYQVSNASTSNAFNVGRSYYQGKRDSYEGDALVGEKGVELAYDVSTSTMRLLGANGPEVTHVSATEHILPHHKTKAILNGGLGAGTVLPGFSDGKGDLLGNIADIGSTVMNWITDPVGEIKDLVDKHNKFQNKDNLEGMGWKAVTKVTDVAKEWAKNKFAEFAATFMSSGSHDGTMGGEGVYKYLYDIALKTMARYPGMSITSGYRPGDPYSHGKHQAIDIAYPASMNGSSKYMSPANWVFENFPQEIAYVITLGQVRDRSGMSGTGSSGQWTRWPDNDHYDHLHINGALGSGEITKSGANVGALGGAKIPGGSGVSRWSGLATQALMMENVFTPLNLAAMLNQIRTESSGNPNTINNWDINAINGTPSKGLLQVIDPTFQTYKRPGYNDIWDPLSNMLASIRYVKARYGTITAGYRGVGYENGGFITHEHQATVGEGNQPEVVIPLSSGKRPRGKGLLRKTAEIFGLELSNKEARQQREDFGITSLNAREFSKEQANLPANETTNSLNPFEKQSKPSIDFHPTIQVTVQSNGNEGSNIEERVKKAVQEATDVLLEQFSSLLLRGEI